VIDLIRAEVLKLRSTRTALGLLIAAIVVSVGPAILVMSLFPRDLLEGEEGAMAAAATGLTLVPVLAVVFGILGMTNEYRHGTITYTYLATPRRLLVIAVKLICYALVGAAVMAITALLVVAVIALVTALRGIGSPSWLDTATVSDAETLRDIGMFLVAVGFMTGFGVGLGALFRAQVPTVAGVLIWALAIENIITAVRPGVGIYLPFTVFMQLNFGPTASTGDGGLQLLSRPEAFLLSLAYIAVVSTAAVYISMRRDVT